MKYTLQTVLLCCGCASLPNAATGATPRDTDAVKVHANLIYAERDTPLTMDLYLPRETSGPLACVIVIQGGGFKARNGRGFRPFALHLAEHGFAAALFAYRGRPLHTYEDTLADVRDAVRHLRRIAPRYGIDPDAIGAMGRSAGATLAVLLAVTEESPETADASQPACRIQAAVGLAGVYDFVSRFTDPDQRALQPQRDTKRETNGEWIGEPFAPDAPRWNDASACRHVDAHDPPLLLVHCRDDRIVPWQQSRDMAQRMHNAGAKAELALYDTGAHACRATQSPTPMERMVSFFRRTLTPQR